MARPPGPEFRWVILTRRSKFNADGTEGSTRRQEEAVRQHIQANGLGRIVGNYSDIKSAYREGVKRQGFEDALAEIEAGRADGIACWKIDRLVRRVSQYRQVLDVLERKGARLFSLVEGIDTADPERKFVNGLILDLLVRLAEMESESTSERIVLMQQDLAKQGKRNGGGTRPFGHTLDWYALVDDEAAAIRKAAKRILKGEGVYAIAQDWNKNGPQPVKAKRWDTTVLTQILLSPRLVAKREYGGELFKLEDVPPILDVPTWERVGAILSDVRPHAPHVKHLLTGLAECGRCERPLRGNRRSSDWKSQAMYVCYPKSAGIGSCGQLAINAKPVNERVETKVIEWLSDKRNVTNLLAMRSNGPEGEALTLQIADKNDALADLSRALTERKIRYPEYSARYDETMAELKELQRRRAVNREAAILVETLAFEDVAAEWNARPLEWKRAILKLCVEQIVIEPVGKTSGAQKGRSGFAFNPDRIRVKLAG
jgi:site-specific DNA recombinase